MAVDEALFRESQRLPCSIPVLRFFSWVPFAVSIGYFQDLEKDINTELCGAARIDVVRRITGGRAVFHQADVTYSVIGREDDPLFPSGILGRYLVISRCLAKGLEAFGIQADLSELSRSGSAGDGLDAFCFSVPSQYELLVGGRKICGSAQARANGSFLQHGSILLDFDPLLTSRLMSPQGFRPPIDNGQNDLEKKIADSTTSVRQEIAGHVPPEEICRKIKAAFERSFGIHFLEGTLTLEERKLKDELVRKKYRTDAWNREKEASF